MNSSCSCDACGENLCPGDLACRDCGAECDPDVANGFGLSRPGQQRGDTIVIEYDVVDADGTPVDCSDPNTKVWFTMKDYLSRPDNRALWQGTLPGDGIVQVSTGKIRVTVPATVTQFIPDGVVKVYYDCQVKDILGRIATIEKGRFFFVPDVTRATS
jgi:hypothetical protein